MTKILRSLFHNYRSPHCFDGHKSAESLDSCVRPRGLDVSLKAAALFVASFALLLGCGPAMAAALPDEPPAPAPASTSPATETVILRMHGSNTIGAELAPALAKAFLRRQGAAEIKVVPRGSDEVSVQGIFPGESAPTSIEIAAHGSATAFTGLKEKCDIGNASRKIKAEEAAGLESEGDMTSPAAEHVLGLDGIAVIVNQSNSLRSMSKDQIRQIFDGEVTDWKQIGREQSGSINVYARDDKSGTYDTFKTLVLGSSPLIANAKRIEDSRELSNSVANDRNGIGFIGLPYVMDAKAVAVYDAGTRPILPTPLTVATETYLLSRRLYLYTVPNPKNVITREFVRFALSREGQDIVEKTGFVGQIVDPRRGGTPALPEDAPQSYKKLVSGAARLPLDFRFRSGKIDLDNKALEDVMRVVEFVSSSMYSGEKIMLLGFADGVGAKQSNLRISQDRANIVAEELASRGVKTSKVVGFGSELPVASNATPEGRDQNRRVEIWLAN